MYNKETKKNTSISAETHKRVTELPELLGIKNAALYKDLDFLNIEKIKDDKNLTWIANEDVERLFLLRKHVEKTGRRNGFTEEKSGQLIVRESANLTREAEEEEVYFEENDAMDIYVEPEQPEDELNLDVLVRRGAELKARDLAMPHLVARGIANEITEEELPEDLKEKVQAAREVANPKFTPTDVAKSIMSRYRKK